MSVRLNGPSEKISSVSTAEFDEMSRNPKVNLLSSMKFGSAVLDSAAFSFKSTLEHPTAKASFVRIDDFANDREESKHQVEFGQFILNAKGIHEQPFFGAVKPHDGIEELLVEQEVSEYLNTISDRQLAYLPLGVWRNVEGIFQLVSLYEHDVMTFDRVFWSDRDLNPEALRPDTVEHALHSSIEGLGYLHGVGVVHGDAEVKNLAHDRQGIRFVDLEDIKHLPRHGNALDDTAEAIDLMRKDIEAFVDSTLQVPENQSKIRPVLLKRTMAKRLAQDYRRGIRSGRKDTGLVLPVTSLQSEDYFKETLDYALGVTRSAA